MEAALVRSLWFLGVRTNAFVVDGFDVTRDAMVAAGIGLIGEPQRDGGVASNHYRGPDGNVYQIIGVDRGAA